MFERFFGPKSEEQKEGDLYEAANKEFDVQPGVNSVSMFHAFNAVRKENEEKNYGFTNNRLLNIVKDCALSHASPMEDIVMGGREQVNQNIYDEIEKLRANLPEEKHES